MSFPHGTDAGLDSVKATPLGDRFAWNRRAFLHAAGWASLGGLGVSSLSAQQTGPSARRPRPCLTPGSIGVEGKQMEVMEMAVRHGFEAVEPFPGFLAGKKSDLGEVRQVMKRHGLTWGASGLSVDFRKDDNVFRQGMKGLPRLAQALQEFEATRVGTWISPSHATLPYLQNFKLHATRLREIASLLKDHGLRLGLEYVGTHTLLVRQRYPFVHTLAETQDLIGEIGTGNVGVVLDTWHWWQAEDTPADIESLKAEDIVSVDLNDAPAGIEKRSQLDHQRELPGATGVIDVAPFLRALAKIGYDGPVRPEPFNKVLNALPNESALEATARAMKKTLALAGSF
ncbi:MAG: sugar phosphate isomerase/epimerase [Verrucomicrobia bacterium]|nr:sugar phosphate isomerase/epimerase [Verrucomicrobiota bacterium]